MELTREYLLWLFEYDRKNGKLYWKNHWDKTVITKFKGKEVGLIDDDGYRRFVLNYKVFFVHKIILFLETGSYPKITDHRDGNRSNNRINNLKSVTNRKNQQNLKCHRSGRLVGAQTTKYGWRSVISIDNKKISLGYFNTELEAHLRYMQELKVRGLS